MLPVPRLLAIDHQFLTLFTTFLSLNSVKGSPKILISMLSKKELFTYCAQHGSKLGLGRVPYIHRAADAAHQCAEQCVRRTKLISVVGV
eukprot:6183482-Pleurochrysis_carterae.AAC.2